MPEASEDPRREHPAREDVEGAGQVFDQERHLKAEAALRRMHAPNERDREHCKGRENSAAREAPPYEWENQVELNFDRKRPEYTVDRAVGRLPPGVDEEQVRDDLLPRCRTVAVEDRVTDRVCDHDRKHVRRHDLDEAAPGKVSPCRLGLARELRSHERERDDEPAQKEEEMDADEAGFGN